MKSHYSIMFAVASLISVFLSVFQTDGFAAQKEPVQENKDTYRIELHVNASANIIYPYLIEEEKISLWNKDETVEVSFPRGIEPKVGKQILITMKRVPTNPTMLMEIVHLETGRLVKTQFIDGPLDGEFIYRLEPQADGSTLLVHEMRIRPVGLFVTILWEIYGKKVHRKKMTSYLNKLKQVVEEKFNLPVDHSKVGFTSSNL